MTVETVSLESICELVVDCPHSTPKWTDSGVIVLRNQNIRNGELDLSSPSYTDEEGYRSRIKRAIPQAGDIVFTREAPMGEVCVIPEGIKCCLGQRQVLLRPRTSVHGEYLYWALQSPFVKHQISWNEGTGTTVSNVRIPVLKALQIPRRGHEEPEIANVLNSLVKQIRINHKINQTLEQIAQAIFKSWFVDFEPVKAKIAALEAGGSEEDALLAAMQAISGKGETELTRLQAEQPEQYAELRTTAELFPSAMQDSELGEMPEGWEPAPLTKLFELHRGFDLPQKSREEGPYEIYAAGGLHGTHSQYKMEPPGIITGRSGVIGNVYLSLKKYWPLNTTLYVRQFRSCGPYYAYHLLKTLDLKSLNSGSAVPSLNRNFVHSIAVLNPGSAVLNKFESLSSSLFEQMVQNIDQSELLSTLRNTLLPKLLSGELSVTDAKYQLAACRT